VVVSDGRTREMFKAIDGVQRTHADISAGRGAG
jgi:hypothetical protein